MTRQEQQLSDGRISDLRNRYLFAKGRTWNHWQWGSSAEVRLDWLRETLKRYRDYCEACGWQGERF